MSNQQQAALSSDPFTQFVVKPLSNPLQMKKTVITEDYRVTSQALGMGINGKVLEIFHKDSGEKYALKVNMLIVIS